MMCREHPSLFLPHIASVIPPVLERCVPSTNNSAIIRSRAPLALGGIAQGILNWRSSQAESSSIEEARTDISRAVGAWFDAAPTTKKKTFGTVPPPPCSQNTLRDGLLQALSVAPAGDTPATTDSVQWALTTLTSITVLLGSRLFETPGAWGLACDAATQLMSKRNTPVLRNVARCWWAGVVWAATQLGNEDEDAEAVWSIVEKVKGSSVCAALVGHGLQAQAGRSERGLRYLHETVKEGHQVGIHVLAKLVGVPEIVTESEPWCLDQMVARQFLDGTLLNCAGNGLGTLYKEVDADVLGASSIAVLTPDQMRTWFAELAGVWEDVVGRVKFHEEEGRWDPPKVVVQIFEELVKVDAEVVVVERLFGLLTSCLVPGEEVSGEKRSPYPRGVPHTSTQAPTRAALSSSSPVRRPSSSYTIDQEDEEEVVENADCTRAIAALNFSRTLWDIIRNTLGPFTTTPDLPSQLITTLLDSNSFRITSPLFPVWSDFLCDVLVNVNSGSVAEEFGRRLDWGERSGVSRALWRVWARKVEEGGLGWVDGMGVLGVPFR